MASIQRLIRPHIIVRTDIRTVGSAMLFSATSSVAFQNSTWPSR